MAKKFVITIVVSFIFFASVNRLAAQRDYKTMLNDLTIHLSSNVDTCNYLNDKIVISVKFQNNGRLSVKLNKNILVTTKDILKTDILKINICCKGNFYEYAFLDGKEAMPKTCKVLMNKSLEIKDVINFSQLMTKKKMETITNINTPKIDNVDFGIYQLQALYIKNSNDTIFSNWISVNYLKN